MVLAGRLSVAPWRLLTPEQKKQHQRSMPHFLQRGRHKFDAEFGISPEETEYQSMPAAYGPQSWWPRLEQWAMKFGPWLNAKPWKCSRMQ